MGAGALYTVQVAWVPLEVIAVVLLSMSGGAAGQRGGTTEQQNQTHRAKISKPAADMKNETLKPARNTEQTKTCKRPCGLMAVVQPSNKRCNNYIWPRHAQVGTNVKKNVPMLPRVLLWRVLTPQKSIGTNRMEQYLPDVLVLIGCRHRTDSMRPAKTVF